MRFVTETVVAVGVAGGAFLFGQVVETPTLPGLPKLDLANMTATGILGWYAYHTASKVIPNMLKDFREESKEQREAFRAEMAEEREHHRSVIDSLGRGQ